MCKYNVLMNELRFAWDSDKSIGNRRKHRVSFEEASSAFYDEQALVIYDPDHSAAEDRFVLLGHSTRARLLVVCHCYRESESIIRIISARKATAQEKNQYWEANP